METNLEKIIEELSLIKMELQDLKARVSKLEESETSTGVYLEGCPDYARDYIEKNVSDNKKDGE